LDSDTPKRPRYLHRVLDHVLADWVALGWVAVAEDHSSDSLVAQGMHAYIIEWAGEGEPVEPLATVVIQVQRRDDVEGAE
jgi:hypothetical protein